MVASSLAQGFLSETLFMKLYLKDSPNISLHNLKIHHLNVTHSRHEYLEYFKLAPHRITCNTFQSQSALENFKRHDSEKFATLIITRILFIICTILPVLTI